MNRSDIEQAVAGELISRSADRASHNLHSHLSLASEGADLSGKQNVIILTSGLTGSSVLTGLISRAGYWTGDNTEKKDDYDTHENRELVECNLDLFQKSAFQGDYLTEFSPEAVSEIASLYGKIDENRFAEFLRKCDQHRPWIWKDPRLWMTIRFWKNLLDLRSCKFILLTRSFLQLWVSATLRRQIRTYQHAREYEQNIRDSIMDFFAEARVPYQILDYDDLIMRPEKAIDQLNAHLSTGLTVADLKKVYRKPLYANPRRSSWEHAKAMLIYAKNYGQRIR